MARRSSSFQPVFLELRLLARASATCSMGFSWSIHARANALSALAAKILGMSVLIFTPGSSFFMIPMRS